MHSSASDLQKPYMHARLGCLRTLIGFCSLVFQHVFVFCRLGSSVPSERLELGSISPHDKHISFHAFTSRESSVHDLTNFNGGIAGEVSCLEVHCLQSISWTLHGMTFTQAVDPWTRLLLLHTLCHVGHCVICSIRCA